MASAAAAPRCTINMVGTDFTQLLHAAALVQGVVDKTPGTYGTDLSFKASQPEVQIRLDRVRAAQYGLNVSDVATTVSTALQGDITAKYRDPKDANQYNIDVILAKSERNSIYTVGNIPVGYQNGNPIRAGRCRQHQSRSRPDPRGPPEPAAPGLGHGLPAAGHTDQQRPLQEH